MLMQVLRANNAGTNPARLHPLLFDHQLTVPFKVKLPNATAFAPKGKFSTALVNVIFLATRSITTPAKGTQCAGYVESLQSGAEFHS